MEHTESVRYDRVHLSPLPTCSSLQSAIFIFSCFFYKDIFDVNKYYFTICYVKFLGWQKWLIFESETSIIEVFVMYCFHFPLYFKYSLKWNEFRHWIFTTRLFESLDSIRYMIWKTFCFWQVYHYDMWFLNQSTVGIVENRTFLFISKFVVIDAWMFKNIISFLNFEIKSVIVTPNKDMLI